VLADEALHPPFVRRYAVHDRTRVGPDAGVLAEPAAARLLARASEAAGVAALIAAGALAVIQTRAPAGTAAPMVEEALLLRCLSPGEAAELLRPLLPLSTNSVVYSPAHAPRVLTIRATAAQRQKVRAVLDQYEGAGSAACAPRPVPAVNP
jgi:hypothetical protein